MVTAAEVNDRSGFYEALFQFAIVSVAEADNPVLASILSELLPNVRRMQYLSILLKTDKLKDNIAFFDTIIDCMHSRDLEKGVKAMHDYVMAEKEFVLSVIDGSPYAHYIED